MKYKSQWHNNDLKKVVDYSERTEMTYQEIAPFSIDPETGEFLNKTPLPKLIPLGLVDVQERIDSFKKDVDVYTILEKVLITGDESLLKRKQAVFTDVYDLPDNIHELTELYQKISTLDVESIKNKLEDAGEATQESVDLKTTIAETLNSLLKEKGLISNGETQ